MGLFARKISSYFPLFHALTPHFPSQLSHALTLSPSHALTASPAPPASATPLASIYLTTPECPSISPTGSALPPRYLARNPSAIA